MKLKRYISLLLLVVMLVMSVPNVTPAFASELTLVNGYYEIKTENDFYLIKDLSAQYKIVSDITITKEFEPLGSFPEAFSGKIIGALNGENSKKPTITIENDSFKGIVNVLDNGEIRNLILAGNIKSESNVIGGFVNYAKNGKIKELVNNADITINYSGSDNAYFGGIIGTNIETGTLTVSACENNGKITVNSAKKGATGGIAGKLVFSNEKSSMTDVENTGEITAAVNNVGGIVGSLDTKSPLSFVVNKGKITSSNTLAYAGGIVGYGYGNIELAGNMGEITSSNIAGGIVGNLAANNVYTITDAYNSGDITASKTAGGIVGAVSDSKSVSINNVYNRGSLTANVTNAVAPLAKSVTKNGYYLAASTSINGVLSPVADEDMQNISSFAGFSTEVWVIDEESDYKYPVFKSNVPTLDSGFLFIEAEDGTMLNTEFSPMGDSNASGGVYLSATVRHLEYTSKILPTSDPSLTYKFVVDEETQVTPWVRIYIPSASADSFYAGFDGVYKYYGPSTNTEFFWFKLTGEKLTPGEHTFDIYNREFIGLDKVFLTTSPVYFPSGMGGSPDDPVEPVIFHAPAEEKPLVEGHPRLYFTAEDIPTIKENLLKPQNANMYEQHLKNLANTTDGTFPEGASVDSHASILGAIESKAFDYAINGNEENGYSAISSMVQLIATYPLDSITSDKYSTAGEIIHKLAEVYDWCYPLMTEDDKEKFHKLFIYLASALEVGFPPQPVQWVTGHGSETQVLRDYLAAGIAMYDEYPYLYDGAAGIVLDEMVDMRKFYYNGHVHPEGSSYTNIRYGAEVSAMLLFDAIGYPAVMGEEQHYVPYWHVYARRPDGSYLRGGDSKFDADAIGLYRSVIFEPMFQMANYFKDPYLKEETMLTNPGYQPEAYARNKNLTPVEFLIFNDPDLQGKSLNELPLTKYFDSPRGAMIARTGWDLGMESKSVVAEMKIQEYWMHGHAHLDSGAFQIYYKGSLATDSGFYQTSTGGVTREEVNNAQLDPQNNGNTYYGGSYFYNYARRTIAHNCMLVYDPDEEVAKISTVVGDTVANDGGQRFTTVSIPDTYSDFIKDYDEKYKMGETLAHEFGLDPMEPNYTYLKGDLSYAYSDKVSEYERSFMFLNLKNDDVPAVMLVFDRITSKNPAFKKTWLMHTVLEPQVNGSQTVVTDTREDYNGKLTLDTLLPENPSVTTVKGNVVGDIEYIALPVDGGNNESDGYRIEISPTAQNNEDYFLNVMQMSDADSEKDPLPVTKLETATHIGAKIADRVVLFGKGRDRMSTDVEFEFTGEGSYEITVADLTKGTWKVAKDGADYCEAVVTEEGGIAVINGGEGKYKLTYVSEEGKREEITVQAVEKDNLYIKNYKGIYQYTEAFAENGVTMIPADELAKLILMDYTVNADGTEVTYNGYGKTMTVKAGSYTALSPAGNIALNVAPYMIGERLYVPLRPIAENFYQTIEYEEYPGVIVITSRASIPTPGYATIVDCEWISNLDTTNGYLSFDGGISTGWATAAAEGTGDCEITYYFGTPQPISKIEAAFSRSNARTFKYDILISNDKVNWTPVITNGETEITEGVSDYQTIDLGGTRNASYIKFVGKGNSGNNANNLVEIRFKN